jgi:endonuclease/exonuclease/phosphatase family metal-dependent hydrolase
VLLAACGPRAGSAAGPSPAPAPRQPAPPACRPLTVVTYNLRFDNPEDGVHRWELRRTQVGEQIRALAPDLLGTQEVLPHQLADLDAMLPTHAREGVGRDPGGAGEASPLFWRTDRFTREDGGTFWLSDTPERARGPEEPKPWGTWLNRVASWAILRDTATGARILAVNTHFDHASEEARSQSATILVDFVRAHPTDHTIVLGDLNTRPGSVPHRTLAAALADAADRAAEVVRAPGDTSVTRWTELGTPGHHIDHVFVSPRLTVERYEVVDRRFRYQGADRYPSDHLPVAVRLCVPTPPGYLSLADR